MSILIIENGFRESVCSCVCSGGFSSFRCMVWNWIHNERNQRQRWSYVWVKFPCFQTLTFDHPVYVSLSEYHFCFANADVCFQDVFFGWYWFDETFVFYVTTLQIGLRIRFWVGILFCEPRFERTTCTRTLLGCWFCCFVRSIL